MSNSFAKFCFPETSEGFDEVRYAWQPQEACAEYLKTWLTERKLTTRVEDLQPGQWFTSYYDRWNSLYANWKRRHNDWKDSAVRLKEGPNASWRRKENGVKKVVSLKPKKDVDEK